MRLHFPDRVRCLSPSFSIAARRLAVVGTSLAINHAEQPPSATVPRQPADRSRRLGHLSQSGEAACARPRDVAVATHALVGR